jgi:hypothetical protein
VVTTEAHAYEWNNAGVVAGSGHLPTVVTYNGQTWSPPVTIDPGTNGLDALSCASKNFCMAVDGSGNAIRYNGTTWSTPQTIDKGNYLESISCRSAQLCQAVDSAGNLLTYQNGSWRPPVSIDGQNQITAIDCVATTSCVAADGNGLVLQLNGRAVQYREQIKPFFYSKWVSCPSLSFCLIVNEVGQSSAGRS